MNVDLITKFVRESNEIERIFRDPTHEECAELERFMSLNHVSIEQLERFVSVYQPDAKLRDQYGMNVKVGRYYPPFGGPEIRSELNMLLANHIKDAYHLHLDYEKLHPFTDCNGRSGRALWAWRNKDIDGGFLLNFYFQTLSAKSSTKSNEIKTNF